MRVKYMVLSYTYFGFLLNTFRIYYVISVIILQITKEINVQAAVRLSAIDRVGAHPRALRTEHLHCFSHSAALPPKSVGRETLISSHDNHRITYYSFLKM